MSLPKQSPKPNVKSTKCTLTFLNKLINEEQANSKCVISSALSDTIFERIADHAVYVCESIVYIVTGEKISFRLNPYCADGTSTIKVVPFPIFVSKLTLPPNASASFFTTANPNP